MSRHIHRLVRMLVLAASIGAGTAILPQTGFAIAPTAEVPSADFSPKPILNFDKSYRLFPDISDRELRLVNASPLYPTSWGLFQVRASDTCKKQGCAVMARLLSVSNAAELQTALSQATSGDKITLQQGDYGALVLTDQDFGTVDAPVTIVSADPGAPAIISGLDLKNVSGLRFENVTFDYTFAEGDNPEWADPFTLSQCENIAFHDTVFDGDLTEGRNDIVDGSPAGFGLKLAYCDGVSVTESTFSGFFKAFHVFYSTDTTFSGNEVTEIRSDGLNFVASQGILVENNHIHSFHVLEGGDDHRDMIQFWTEGTDVPSSDIVIRSNLLDVGTGGYTQSIFMLNEMVERHKTAGEEMYYQDITIENNVIVNSHFHGITVGASDGVIVRNNSVLRNPDGQQELGEGDISTPFISVSGMSKNVTIENNLTGGLRGPRDQADWTVENNHVVQDRDPGQPNYYGDIFIGGAMDRSPDKLVLRPDSDLAQTGAGAEDNQYTGQSETLSAMFVSEAPAGFNVRFDARLSTDADGQLDESDALFLWDFGDGTSGTSQIPTHTYAEPGIYEVTLTVIDDTGARATTRSQVVVEGSKLLSFDAADGHFVMYGAAGMRGIDLSGDMLDEPEQATVLTENSLSLSQAVPTLDQPDLFVDEPLSPLKIGRSHEAVELERWQVDRLFGAENFSIDFTLRNTGITGGTGEVLRVHQVVEVHVDAKGEVIAKLMPGSDQEVRLQTEGANLTDGAWHDLTVQFDSDTGLFSILQGGVLIAEGATNLDEVPSAQHWGLAIGAPWGRAFEGEISDLKIQVDLADLGVPDIGSGPALLPELDDSFLLQDGRILDGSTNLPDRAGMDETLDIGTRQYAVIDRDTLSEFHGAEAFNINFELRSDKASGNWGEVLRVHEALEIWVSDTGELVAKVFPGQANEVRLVSSSGSLYDQNWHDISLRYDSTQDVFQILIDGQLEAEGNAPADMPEMRYWGFTLGASWAPGFDGQIRGLEVKAAHVPFGDTLEEFSFAAAMASADVTDDLLLATLESAPAPVEAADPSPALVAEVISPIEAPDVTAEDMFL